MFQRFKMRWHRLSHWEYWPMWMIYLPLSPMYILMSIRNGGIGFFTRVNPCFPLGGMGLMDKEVMYGLLDQCWYPRTVYLIPGKPLTEVFSSMEDHGIDFPVILKPAKGCRGSGVQLVYDRDELSCFLNQCSEKFLLQEWISYANEVGIFFIKEQKDAVGFVSGIVQKSAVTIVGDGIRTKRQLILSHPRYYKLLMDFENDASTHLDIILERDEISVLSSIGNHARGSTFLDLSHWITPELNDAMNKLLGDIVDFHYGRLDIKYNNWDELLRLENISIMEINGANSEPAHVYDPKHSYFFGLFTFAKHWWWMNRIAWRNRNTCEKMGFRDSLALLKETGMF